VESGIAGARTRLAVDLLAAFSSVLIIAYLLGVFFIDPIALYCIILSLFFILEYLPDIAKSDLKRYQKVFSMVLMICGILPHIYLFLNVDRIRIMYGTIYTTADVFFGTMASLTVIAWAKRRFGWAMPIIAIAFSLFVLLGHLIPLPWGHRYYRFGRYVSFIFGESGMYGSLMAISIRVIFLYMLFGAFLNKSGAGDYLLNASLALAGKYRGGPAKVVVISSALLGTVNGSAVANVVTTGGVTIPMMKKTGYHPVFAAAIEAVASTGGQILPPVLGAGAFIMAEFLGVAYSDVALAATIPALLYYIAVFLQVDLVAVKTGLKGAAPESLPDKKIIFQKIYMILPIVVLIYLLMVARFTVTRAGLFAVLSTLIISWTKDIKANFNRIYSALIDGARESVGITAIMMVAGIIVGAVTCSGFAPKFSSMVLTLAGGNKILTAFFTSLICIIIGLGLPTAAAYIITTAIALPALIRTGIEPLAAHMFVFYFAILANITPPIAPAVYAASAIAGVPPMKTAFEGMKLAVLAYLMPFLFLNNTNLLGQGAIIETIQAFATAVFGCFILAMIIQGVTFKGNRISLLVRLIWTGAGLALLEPSAYTDVIGFVLFAAGLPLHIYITKKKRGDAKSLFQQM